MATSSATGPTWRLPSSWRRPPKPSTKTIESGGHRAGVLEGASAFFFDRLITCSNASGIHRQFIAARYAADELVQRLTIYVHKGTVGTNRVGGQLKCTHESTRRSSGWCCSWSAWLAWCW